LPGSAIVLRFEFEDLRKERIWWLVVEDGHVDVCVKDPGRDVDVYINTTVRVMTDVWLGHKTYKSAIKEGVLEIVGPSGLVRSVSSWLRCVDYAEVSVAGWP